VQKSKAEPAKNERADDECSHKHGMPPHWFTFVRFHVPANSNINPISAGSAKAGVPVGSWANPLPISPLCQSNVQQVARSGHRLCWRMVPQTTKSKKTLRKKGNPSLNP
jgi:hypothetical protein